MDLRELKLNNLEIDKEKFGRIFSFVDFGNVNYWYEWDERDGDENLLPANKKLVVDVEKLAVFSKLFSDHNRFYFGLDPEKDKSIKIISKARRFFNKVIPKPIQKIKHYLNDDELKITTRLIKKDLRGQYIRIPKCNFDVEISVDAVRFLDKYDTFCLFSSDADFAYLAEFLLRKKKKIILFSSGYVSFWLKGKATLNINSQRIKKDITFIKEKPRLFRGGISISDPHPRTG